MGQLFKATCVKSDLGNCSREWFQTQGGEKGVALIDLLRLQHLENCLFTWSTQVSLEADDTTAPQRVLLPTQKINDEEDGQNKASYREFLDDNYDCPQHLKEPSGPSTLIPKNTLSVRNRRGEKEETSVIPGPGINFLNQYLHSFEEDIGSVNKVAPVLDPQLDLDPDIVVAPGDDFDFDNPDSLCEMILLFRLMRKKRQRGNEYTKSQS
ncbi:hypothetical protein HPG69_006493 [Diceros bicornis minor]|uniref:Uncharacterized protein n=1 Tax=Diceros bicornis minor TaxID=77932 RepID=A0A7J7F5U7_DICBM|nr:hypothetical protein HPG69_006493 [Diceros bicornis minor]